MRVLRGPAPGARLRTLPCSAQVVERLPFEYSTFLAERGHFLAHVKNRPTRLAEPEGEAECRVWVDKC